MLVHDDKSDEQLGIRLQHHRHQHPVSLSPYTSLTESFSIVPLDQHIFSIAQSVGCHHRIADLDKNESTIETTLEDRDCNLSSLLLPIPRSFDHKGHGIYWLKEWASRLSGKSQERG
jgi:hypothetical protein